MRKQMRLSLQAVEAMSEQEFKASVLGAYERGERAISVPRLHAWPSSTTCRSTSCCHPTMPPSPGGGRPGRRRRRSRPGARRAGPRREGRIDLTKLHTVSGPERDLLRGSSA